MSCLHFLPPSPHLLPSISWKTPPSKSKVNGLSLTTLLSPCLYRACVRVSLFYYRSSVSTSLYTLMILRGTYSQRLFRVLKLITHFPNVTILPSESSFMCWEKHYVKYAETRILVYMQFLKIVCTKQKCSGSFSRLLKAKHPTPSHKSSSGVTPPSSYRSSTFVRQH